MSFKEPEKCSLWNDFKYLFNDTNDINLRSTALPLRSLKALACFDYVSEIQNLGVESI